MGESVGGRAAKRCPDRPMQCHSPGCTKTTQRSSGTGLSRLHCKLHVEFHRRHGSFWHRSFLAADLAPYRKAARCWLKAHHDDPRVLRAASALDGLLEESGEPASAYDTRRLSPSEKARIALARLRQAGIAGVRLIEITLMISARIEHRGPFGNHEFLTVQIAKVAHRLASGTHRTRSGMSRIPSKYPHSAGRVLRMLGHKVWDIAIIATPDAAVRKVITMAEPEVAQVEKAEAVRQANRSAFAQEIERVRRMGIGPEMFAKYERQLKRQYGIR